MACQAGHIYTVGLDANKFLFGENPQTYDWSCPSPVDLLDSRHDLMEEARSLAKAEEPKKMRRSRPGSPRFLFKRIFWRLIEV